MFGRYALLIVMLAIAEWLVDFGTSDVFVREICRNSADGLRLLRVLTALKALQLAVAAPAFCLFVILLRYPSDTIQASFVAAASLLFFSGTLVYHTLFKATLAMEREVAAELVSVLVMIALLRAGPTFGGALTTIFACHMASRATFFGLCFWFGKAKFRLSCRGVRWADVRSGFNSSAAIGSIGLMVTLYESMDLLLLSKLGSLADVAYYAGAQRFVSPVVVALAAIGGTLYPVAATYWPAARAEFERSCQKAVDVVFVMAGLAITVVIAGSDLLMRSFGPELATGAAILRVLALVLFVKAISNTLGPVLYVVQAQNHALTMVVAALVAKGLTIAVVAPRFGYIGVAFAAVAVDSLTAMATLFMVRKYAGFSVKWSIPIKTVAITLAVALSARALLPGHSLEAAGVAVALFVPLILISGCIRMSEVLPLLRWNAP